jgi:predicted esterase
MDWLKDRSWLNSYLFPSPCRDPPSSSDIKELKFYHRENQEMNLREFIYRRPEPEAPKKLVVYCHGNGQDLLDVWIPLSGIEGKQLVDDKQVAFLCVEYPGYGEDRKRQSCTESLLRDEYPPQVEEVLQHLGWALRWHDVILVGYSLGSAAVCELASRHKVHQLILIAPFVSIKQVALDHEPFWGKWMMDRLSNLDKMKKSVMAPVIEVTFLHGKQDRLIDYTHSLRLAQILEEERKIPVHVYLYTHRNHQTIGQWNVYTAKIVV